MENSSKDAPQRQHREIKIPDNIPKVYAIGAMGGFTPYDFRIMFFDAGRFQPEAKVEVALSPLAAKELRDWLDSLIKDFEKKIRKIEKTGGMAKSKDGEPAPPSTMRMFG